MFEEHSIVYLRKRQHYIGGWLPPGTHGTVVGIHKGGEAYEIEFMMEKEGEQFPESIVLTVLAEDLLDKWGKQRIGIRLETLRLHKDDWLAISLALAEAADSLDFKMDNFPDDYTFEEKKIMKWRMNNFKSIEHRIDDAILGGTK